MIESGPAVDAEATRASARPDPSRLMGNTVALLGSRIATAVMGWAGSVVIARHLSPDDWGKFSLVFGVLSMMAVVTDLGVGRVVLARLTGDDREDARGVAGSFIALRLMLGLLGYLVAVGFVVVSGYSGDVVAATAVAGIVVVIATPSHALTVLYQSRLRLTYVAAAESIAQLVQLLLTVLAALVAPVLIVFVLPAVANEVVSIAIKIRGLLTGVAGERPSPRPALWRWRAMLIEALPLSIGFAFIEVSSRIDLVMLARLDTFDSVGLYSVGLKFSDFALIAALAVITPFTTVLVSSWPDRPGEFVGAARRATTVIATLCGVGVAAFWPVSGDLIGLLYGDRFAAAGLSARLLVAAGALGALSQLAIMTLVATGRHRVYPLVALVALAVNIALNLVLIPRHSFDGAAWAVLVSQVFMLLVLAAVIVKTVPAARVVAAGPVGGIAALVVATCACAVWLPGYRDLPSPVLAALGAFVTLAVAHAAGWTGTPQAALAVIRGRRGRR